MITLIKRHIQGNIIGWVALFAALTGSSYAAVKMAKGSVKSVHIAKGAVNSSKVKDASLAAKDFKASELKSLASAGPQGAPGPQGPKGPLGEQGTSGISEYELIKSISQKVSETSYTTTAICPQGKSPLGRPAYYIGSTTLLFTKMVVDITEVEPIFDGEAQIGWNIKAEELMDTVDSWQIYTYLTCAKIA